MYFGFDISAYPGDDVLASLRESGTPSNASFVAAYLAPTVNHSDTSWMARMASLADAGRGLAPVYVGRQAGSSALDTNHGQADAQECTDLADNQAGLGHGRVIYLDVETSDDVGSDHLDYIAAWFEELASGGLYTPGVYCSARPTDHSGIAPAAQIADRIGATHPFWVYRFPPIKDITIDVAAEQPPDPTKKSGFGGALVQQYRQSGQGGNVTLTWDDSIGPQTLVGVDVDSSLLPDPSVLTPAVTTVDPPEASIGETITISGSGLAAVDEVTMGTAGVTVQKTDITIGSPAEQDTLHIIVPDDAPTGQTVDLTIHNVWDKNVVVAQAITVLGS